MAAPEQTPRPGSGFSPDAEARRAARLKREERFKAAVVEAMDIGRGFTADVSSKALDGGEALAVAAATKAAAVGRPLRPHERQAVRDQSLAEQTKPKGTSPEQWRAAVRAYIAKIPQAERIDVLTSPWYEGLSKRAQQEADELLAEAGAFSVGEVDDEEEELGPDWREDGEDVPFGDENLLGYASDEAYVDEEDEEEEVE